MVRRRFTWTPKPSSEKAMATHSSTLAWKIPWMEEPGRLQSMGSLSWTRLNDFTFTFHFHALEKEMATHSSVLAWRIPGMGEAGELLSMGSHSRTRLKRLSSSSKTLLPKGNDCCISCSAATICSFLLSTILYPHMYT